MSGLMSWVLVSIGAVLIVAAVVLWIVGLVIDWREGRL